MKHQVIKIEKNYVGTYKFENAEPALEMFRTFVEEAKREGELEITQKIYLTVDGKIITSWELLKQKEL